MPIEKSYSPTVIDLFSGAGGLSLGASRAGFVVKCAIEIDDKAIETHQKNFPHVTHLKQDISTFEGKDVLESVGLCKGHIDGLIGGPPCQGFSTIGRQNLDDPRSSLFNHFFRLVNEIRPKFFLAENVPGILNPRFDNIRSEAFSHIQNDYVILPPIVIKANEYGAPTIRTRVFFIGYDPKTYPKDLLQDDFLSLAIPETERVRVRRALIGLPVELEPYDSYNGFTKMEYDISQVAKPNSFEEHLTGRIPINVGSPTDIYNYLVHQKITGCTPTQHSPELIKRYRELPQGQTDSISRSVKLDPDGFCPTLRAGTGPDKGSYQAVRPIHYSQPRVITPREAARLQGFPDWFIFHPTKWHSFRQIGNSVSPIIAQKLLEVIYQKMT